MYLNVTKTDEIVVLLFSKDQTDDCKKKQNGKYPTRDEGEAGEQKE